VVCPFHQVNISLNMIIYELLSLKLTVFSTISELS